MERLTLYLFYHNYLKPHRTAEPRLSHALVAGYDAGEIERGLGELWETRAWHSHTELTESGRETWLKLRKTPLWNKPDYLPRHAAA